MLRLKAVWLQIRPSGRWLWQWQWRWLWLWLWRWQWLWLWQWRPDKKLHTVRKINCSYLQQKCFSAQKKLYNAVRYIYNAVRYKVFSAVFSGLWCDIRVLKTCSYVLLSINCLMSKSGETNRADSPVCSYESTHVASLQSIIFRVDSWHSCSENMFLCSYVY